MNGIMEELPDSRCRLYYRLHNLIYTLLYFRPPDRILWPDGANPPFRVVCIQLFHPVASLLPATSSFYPAATSFPVFSYQFWVSVTAQTASLTAQTASVTTRTVSLTRHSPADIVFLVAPALFADLCSKIFRPYYTIFAPCCTVAVQCCAAAARCTWVLALYYPMAVCYCPVLGCSYTTAIC